MVETVTALSKLVATNWETKNNEGVDLSWAEGRSELDQEESLKQKARNGRDDFGPFDDSEIHGTLIDPAERTRKEIK